MKKRLPLFEAIEGYAESSPARFHMPGHKGKLSRLDVTELTPTDDLHRPSGAILESERLCAEAMGAANAFFSVNGSTACMLAMLELAGHGKRILLGRGCHKSAINGVALARQEVIYLFPDEDGVYSANSVDRALSENPCAAVFITSPTYRGAVSPIADIAQAAHRHGALLIVDSAHGAHFAYSDELPPVPKEADLWCVSSHKTLNALTQTALLLSGESCPFSENEVRGALCRYLSTSPSYELMLSIERAVLAPENWDKHVERIKRVRNILKGIRGISLIENDDWDITRLNVRAAGTDGRSLARLLESRGIFPEMADGECVTLITTPADEDEWYLRLVSALESISANANGASASVRLSPIPENSEQAVPVYDAVFSPSEQVPLEYAAGRICAEACGAYPPGIAILFPGERISERSVSALLSEKESGAVLFGLDGGCVSVCMEEFDG